MSQFFINTGRMMGPIQRVNVDLASGMLEELDQAAKELNISRQAVIKTPDTPSARSAVSGTRRVVLLPIEGSILAAA